MNRKQSILFHVIFVILCAGCLFSTQAKIHDALIQSKWYAFYFIVPCIALFSCWFYKGTLKLRVVDMIACIIVSYLSLHNLLYDNLMGFWINLLSILSLYFAFRLRVCCMSFSVVAWVMLSCSAILAIWGLFQIDSWRLLYSNVSFTGPFESCAAYAVSLALCFPFTMYLFLYEPPE